jgi:C1A family cysteine protease
MRKLGCKPDPVDRRDKPMSQFVNLAEPLPREFSLVDYCTVVQDQGRIGDCVGYGTTAAKENQDRYSGQYTKLSAIWLYDQCKHLDGDPLSEGTSIRVAMRILAKEGCAPEEAVPFDGKYTYGQYDGLNIDPALTRPFKIKAYARLISTDEMCRCLVQHGAFAIGIQVTDGFEKTGEDGVIPIHYNKVLGGHCVAVVGYSLVRKTLTILNSWGDDWGKCGYAELPFPYWRRLGMDAWGMVDISPNEA